MVLLVETDEHGDMLGDRLGANIRTLREQAGMSQAELARQMTGHGHTWHPNTVYRVESGKQIPRLDEAAHLAKVLKTSIDRLTWPTQEASTVELLNRSARTARAAYCQIAEATQTLLAARRQLTGTLTRTEHATSQRIRDTRGEALEAAALEPEDAVEDGRERHAELLEHLAGQRPQEGGDAGGAR